MRKLYILILLSLTITFAYCSKLEKNQYRIFGKIENLGDKTGSIVVPDATAERGIRYVKIQFKDGEFEYIGTIDKPQVLRFWIDDNRVKKTIGRGYIPVKSGLLWFIAAPGKEIEVRGEISDFVNAYPYDGAENDIFSSFMKKVFPIINEQGNFMVENAVNKELTKAQKKEIQNKLQKLREQEHQIRLDFLKKHISSVAGLWLLEDMIIRSQIEMGKVEGFLNNVESEYYTLPYYSNLKMRMKGFKSAQVGQMAPAIVSSNTYDGKEFDLKSMHGKYTIIDFWGTWCGACIAGVPAMKAFRDKHADKIQILGIAQDRNVELWKKFIDDKGMNFKAHLINGKGNNDFVSKFNVTGFPTKILLNPNGKIILRETGESEEFYKEVEELMK